LRLKHTCVIVLGLRGMQSESSSNSVFTPTTGESWVKPSPVRTDRTLPDRYIGDSEDSEEAALARASTVVIEDVETPDSAPTRTLDLRPNYYIQGVIQGELIYVITNLLGRDSQTLFQPQRVWTIGRNRDAALPLRDRALSRRHAVIHYVPHEGFHLIDLNSMNGSFINRVRIRQRQPLKDGDRVKLGSLELNFFCSTTARTINPIHPEVLARFTSPQSKPEGFMDYASLEEPDILFQPGLSSH
jgi:pSer/pThr/pTyr-binding forkhead associated (FHA) protein